MAVSQLSFGSVMQIQKKAGKPANWQALDPTNVGWEVGQNQEVRHGAQEE
jgi:hypothetical protein